MTEADHSTQKQRPMGRPTSTADVIAARTWCPDNYEMEIRTKVIHGVIWPVKYYRAIRYVPETVNSARSSRSVSDSMADIDTSNSTLYALEEKSSRSGTGGL